MMNKTVLGAAMIVVALGLSACGSSTTVQQTETQGQQLMDLKEAYDSGVITEKEYNKTRTKILKG
jgi:uncharacterized membrane protein